jgi:hypothetical protein
MIPRILLGLSTVIVGAGAASYAGQPASFSA